MVLATPIVRLLFEHGAFTAADTARDRTRADDGSRLALPAHVLAKALVPTFFAREDTRQPLLATLKGIGPTRSPRTFLLGHWFGADGSPPPSRSAHGSLRLSLIRTGHGTFGFSIDTDAKRRLPRIVLATALVMWQRCCGCGSRLVPALAFAAHGLVQAILLLIVIISRIALRTACSCGFSASPAGARRSTPSGQTALTASRAGPAVAKTAPNDPDFRKRTDGDR